jgi:hypothetical protein
MTGKNRRGLLILALVVLCLGVLAGRLYGSQGVPGQLEFLFQVVEDLAEESEDHDEKIELIVAHIGELKASLCEFYGDGPRPSFCGLDGPDSDCVPGICDTQHEGDPCESANPPPTCDAGGGPGGD